MSIELPKMIPEITNINVEHTIKYYSNGQKKYKGSYVSYHPVFNHISWYENGNKKSEGFYKGIHERHGKWKFWHSNGQLACTGIYEDMNEDLAKTKPGLRSYPHKCQYKLIDHYYARISIFHDAHECLYRILLIFYYHSHTKRYG